MCHYQLEWSIDCKFSRNIFSVVDKFSIISLKKRNLPPNTHRWADDTPSSSLTRFGQAPVPLSAVVWGANHQKLALPIPLHVKILVFSLISLKTKLEPNLPTYRHIQLCPGINSNPKLAEREQSRREPPHQAGLDSSALRLWDDRGADHELGAGQ